MKIRKRKTQIQRMTAVLLMAALSCVCVLGDYCQTCQTGNDKISRDLPADTADLSVPGNGQISRLRSADTVETAKSETAMAEIQEALLEGYGRLAAAQEDDGGLGETADAFAALVSRSVEQMEEELQQTDNGTKEYQEYRDSILASCRKLENMVQKRKDKNFRSVVAEIGEIINPQTEVRLPGGDLPFRAIEAQDIPVQRYSAPEDYQYRPASRKAAGKDLQSAGNTRIDDRIREDFQDCESPLEVYQKIRNTYLMEFYYGSRKGALGTYEQKAGNDYDIASLLIGIFRDRDIPARYVTGEIQITAEQAMDWTAAEEIETAKRQIAAMGIPATALESGGSTVAIRMEHTWVEAYIPYTDYRGAGRHSGKCLWIPLDPSFKTVSWLEGEDLSGLSDYVNQDKNTLQQDTELFGVGVGELSSFAEGPESSFMKYMLENGYGEATLAEAYGGRQIQEEDLGYLPLTLPYAVNGTVRGFSEIPKNRTDKITITLAGDSVSDGGITGEADIQETLYMPDLYGKRLILAYVPATEQDREILEEHGGLFQAPAYLFRLKPQLLMDGEVIAEGSSCHAGCQQEYTVRIQSAAPGRTDADIGNTVVAGGMYCVTSDYGNMAADCLQQSADRLEDLRQTVSQENIYTDEAMGILLDSIGKAYFAQNDLYHAVIAGQNNVAVSRDLSMGIVGFRINVISSFGRPAELNEGGIFLDIGDNVHSVISRDRDGDAEKEFMLHAGIHDSAMEHGVLEEATGIESVSAIKILEQAKQESIPLHTLHRENLPEEIDALVVAGSVKQEIRTAVTDGKIVVIPEWEIARNDWSGSGYMVFDPDTFACGYMISGGLAGGAMTMNQAMGEYVATVLSGLCFVFFYQLFKTLVLAVAPFGWIAGIFMIAECILLLKYIRGVVELWDLYFQTGEVKYLQKTFIQVASFLTVAAMIPKMKANLEKCKASLRRAVAKLKVVLEYSESVGACFIAGTLVLSASGFLPVERVAAGGMVQSFDPETQQVSLKEVEETFVRETKELVHVTVVSETITTTPEHPFYTASKGFLEAEKLRAGDILATVHGESVIVEQVQHEILEWPVQVYNLRVAENHTYFVGRVAIGVHNAKCAQPAGIKDPLTNKYKPSQKFIEHITVGNGKEPSGKCGINGAHRATEFYRLVKQFGCKINSETELEPGIKEIKYQKPLHDGTKPGNPVVEGQYKTQEFRKTIYDPGRISDEAFIERGFEALENRRRSQPGDTSLSFLEKDNKGLEWRIQLNDDREPVTFYPERPKSN